MTHQFVEAIPERPESGTLYVSIEYGTAVHLCCCGCQREVITPITPTDWTLSFDGITVSLSPSIGNWSFECRSHYFITKNRVRWAASWSEARVAQARAVGANRQSTPESRPSDPPLEGTIRNAIRRVRDGLARLVRGS